MSLDSRTDTFVIRRSACWNILKVSADSVQFLNKCYVEFWSLAQAISFWRLHNGKKVAFLLTRTIPFFEVLRFIDFNECGLTSPRELLEAVDHVPTFTSMLAFVMLYTS